MHFLANEFKERHCAMSSVRGCRSGPALQGAAASWQQRLIARRTATRDAPRWSGQQQDDENHHRGQKKRYDKCTDEAHAAMGAAEPDKDAERDIQDQADRKTHLTMISFPGGPDRAGAARMRRF